MSQGPGAIRALVYFIRVLRYFSSLKSVQVYRLIHNNKTN